MMNDMTSCVSLARARDESHSMAVDERTWWETRHGRETERMDGNWEARMDDYERNVPFDRQ